MPKEWTRAEKLLYTKFDQSANVVPDFGFSNADLMILDIQIKKWLQGQQLDKNGYIFIDEFFSNIF